MILLLLIILSIYMYPICMKFWPKYILYLKKLRVDDLLEKRKVLIPFSFTSCNDLNGKLEQRCFEQCMSMGYGPITLLGSGFDKMFLPR